MGTLSDFDTPTILEELSERFEFDIVLEIESLLDKQKLEHLIKAFDKYSIQQLQALIPV